MSRINWGVSWGPGYQVPRVMLPLPLRKGFHFLHGPCRSLLFHHAECSGPASALCIQPEQKPVKHESFLRSPRISFTERTGPELYLISASPSGFFGTCCENPEGKLQMPGHQYPIVAYSVLSSFQRNKGN